MCWLLIVPLNWHTPYRFKWGFQILGWHTGKKCAQNKRERACSVAGSQIHRVISVAFKKNWFYHCTSISFFIRSKCRYGFFRIVYENETPFLGLFCSAKYVTKVDFSHSNRWYQPCCEEKKKKHCTCPPESTSIILGQ